MALLPGLMTRHPWPVRLAWAVAIVALVGGVMVFFGMFTRISAICFAALALAALWLVDIGPAIASGTAVLGFLPSAPPFSLADWQGPLWRLLLGCASLALAFAGPGLAALDNVLWGSGSSRDSSPPPPKPPKEA